MAKSIIGFGELLWDMLPTGKQIGGAPGNFAYHAGQLGLDSTVVSAVGNDDLGDEILKVAGERGLGRVVERVAHPTGTVDVTLDAAGIPQYRINEQVAWDYIPMTPMLAAKAKTADAICFGSLAQRHETSRQTLAETLALMDDGALKVFDVNLRQHYYSAEVLRTSLEKSNVLKLNDEEIFTVAGLLNEKEGTMTDVCRGLMEHFGLRMAILTCGSAGSYVMDEGDTSFLETPRVEVADTVGAGDAFTAAFCAATMQGANLREAHRQAVEVSAYVCTQSGAMPPLPDFLK